MFKLVNTVWNCGKIAYYPMTSRYPAECCGARWGSRAFSMPLMDYFDDDHPDPYVSNKGIHVWPTKVNPNPGFGEVWDVTLGGETLTVSIILDPHVPVEGVVVPSPQIEDTETGQTVYSVFFSYITGRESETYLHFSDQRFLDYYGCSREVFRGAFKQQLNLISPTSHLMFILTDEQIPVFERLMSEYGKHLKRIQYPHKIVNRNFQPEDNPRLTLLFLTLDI